jgi:uncharacterized membrane protein
VKQREASIEPAAGNQGGRILSPRRATTCLAAGLVAGLAAARLGELGLSLLTGWVAAASLVLAWVWSISWRQDADGTQRLAVGESKSRSTDLPVLIASATSVAGVILALTQSSNGHNGVRVALPVLSLVASLLAWALVNTVFAFKYARRYYVDTPGGINFKQQQAPTYSDFAYLAFTIGMSYATSDSELANSAVRKTVLGHALLSYGFGTITIAVAINLVTTLGQS